MKSWQVKISAFLLKLLTAAVCLPSALMVGNTQTKAINADWKLVTRVKSYEFLVDMNHIEQTNAGTLRAFEKRVARLDTEEGRLAKQEDFKSISGILGLIKAREVVFEKTLIEVDCEQHKIRDLSVWLNDAQGNAVYQFPSEYMGKWTRTTAGTNNWNIISAVCSAYVVSARSPVRPVASAIEPRDAGFRVLMPGEIKEQQRTEQLGSYSVAVTTVSSEIGRESYFVVCTTYPTELAKMMEDANPETIFKFARGRLIQSVDGLRVTGERSLSLDGYPGREIAYAGNSSQVFLRAYWALPHFYQLLTIDETPREYLPSSSGVLSETARKFVNSFVILSQADPNHAQKQLDRATPPWKEFTVPEQSAKYYYKLKTTHLPVRQAWVKVVMKELDRIYTTLEEIDCDKKQYRLLEMTPQVISTGKTATLVLKDDLPEESGWKTIDNPVSEFKLAAVCEENKKNMDK